MSTFFENTEELTPAKSCLMSEDTWEIIDHWLIDLISKLVLDILWEQEFIWNVDREKDNKMMECDF